MEIMLVEDNEAIIMGLEYLLSQEGYQVVTARNMAQAEELLQGGMWGSCSWTSGFLTGTASSSAGR